MNYPPGWSVRHTVDQYAVEFHKDPSVSISFGVIKDDESLDNNFRTAYLSDGSVDVIQRESTLFRFRHAILATLATNKPSSSARRVMTVAGDSKAWGPAGGRGKAEKELVSGQAVLHPETERRATEVGRCGSGVLLERRSLAWLQVPCAEQWLTVGQAN